VEINNYEDHLVMLQMEYSFPEIKTIIGVVKPGSNSVNAVML
jgi:hypothetical protein